MDGDLSAAPSVRSDSFWDLYSRVYDGVYHLMSYRSLLWDAYEALDLEPGMRVLDAGCGTGNFEHFIATKCPPPVEVSAVDASAGMLDAARTKCRELPWASFSAADLNARLPFEDATFDRVVSINVLYALEDHDHVIAELLRVLKPDGILVVSSPLPTYSVSMMVTDHFRRFRNIWGVRRKLATWADSVWALVTSGAAQWVLNNFVINKREEQGAYCSLDRIGMEELLLRRVADGMAHFAIKSASADQNLFATVVKGASA